MTAPTGTPRILQIHPTRLCNLRCHHCYTSSAPELREMLPIDVLRRAVSDATAEGYNVASLSGGEPLLYSELALLLDHIRQQGMHVMLTTNGTLLTEKRLDPLQGRVDLMAVSIDGIPESHNQIRASETAFSAMESNLERLRQSQIPFGFIFTLTQFNLDELEWVADFAQAQGAAMLQVHPLERAGRAASEMIEEWPDEIEKAYAALEVERLQELKGCALPIHLDLVDARMLGQLADEAFAEDCENWREGSFADLVAPLVIEPDGQVSPLQDGFPAQFSLGNILREDLAGMMQRWQKEKAVAFRRVCRETTQKLSQQQALPFVNWYEAISQSAAESLCYLPS